MTATTGIPEATARRGRVEPAERDAGGACDHIVQFGRTAAHDRRGPSGRRLADLVEGGAIARFPGAGSQQDTRHPQGTNGLGIESQSGPSGR